MRDSPLQSGRRRLSSPLGLRSFDLPFACARACGTLPRMSYDHLRENLGLSEAVYSSTPPALLRVLGKSSGDLEKKLLVIVKKYDPASGAVKIESGLDGLVVRVWFTLEADEGLAEAQELANILLGPNAAVGQHKLKKTMWVANVKVKL